MNLTLGENAFTFGLLTLFLVFVYMFTILFVNIYINFTPKSMAKFSVFTYLLGVLTVTIIFGIFLWTVGIFILTIGVFVYMFLRHKKGKSNRSQIASMGE